MTNWQQYQEDVANLFRSLGCDAVVEAQVQGIRAVHKIDVLVRFDHFGLRHLWVIECKNWRRAVTKEKVLALKSLIEDIGADRGILISQSGFQSGAWRATRSTNIDLMDLEELKTVTLDEFMKITLESLDHKIKMLLSEMNEQLYITKNININTSTSYPNPVFDTKVCFKALEKLIYLQFAIEFFRDVGDLSIIRITEEGPEVEFFDHFKDFLEEAHTIVCKVEELWSQQKSISKNRGIQS